jgi:low temperature requirement protein LtrA
VPLFEKEEKKVEYIELIYDLIFVFIIGRNSSLIGHIENGFIAPDMFLTYCLCTLIAIQIWFFTVAFINRYGSNEVPEYVGIIVNMYLLYYMADGTSVSWQESFYRYNIAWLLILFNLTFQYYLKYRSTAKESPWEKAHISLFIRVILSEAAVVAVLIPVFHFTGHALTPFAVFVGIATLLSSNRKNLVAVDFPHLTERVMLFVVFTFGEMIIAISGYFRNDANLTGVYFQASIFIIVVGLFLSYGLLYDKIIDREMSTNGSSYMMLHIFLIFSLSNLTVALEFMAEPEVDLVKKSIYLVVSFIGYYFFLGLTCFFSKNREELSMKSMRPFLITMAFFAVLMALFYRNSFASIGISVIFIFVMYYIEYRYWDKCIKPLEEANG